MSHAAASSYARASAPVLSQAQRDLGHLSGGFLCCKRPVTENFVPERSDGAGGSVRMGKKPRDVRSGLGPGRIEVGQGDAGAERQLLAQHRAQVAVIHGTCRGRAVRPRPWYSSRPEWATREVALELRAHLRCGTTRRAVSNRVCRTGCGEQGVVNRLPDRPRKDEQAAGSGGCTVTCAA